MTFIKHNKVFIIILADAIHILCYSYTMLFIYLPHLLVHEVCSQTDTFLAQRTWRSECHASTVWIGRRANAQLTCVRNNKPEHLIFSYLLWPWKWIQVAKADSTYKAWQYLSIYSVLKILLNSIKENGNIKVFMIAGDDVKTTEITPPPHYPSPPPTPPNFFSECTQSKWEVGKKWQ